MTMKKTLVFLALAACASTGVLAQDVYLAPAQSAASSPFGRLTLPDSSRPAPPPNVPLGGVSNMPPTTAFFVNEKALMVPSVGTSDIRIIYMRDPAGVAGGDGTGAGDFRTGCDINRMGRFDPLVHPGQAESGHLHTFFGNGSLLGTLDETTLGNLANFGTSTCHGGIANRSAYWVPTMIDIRTGMPVPPADVRVYYKNSVNGWRGEHPKAVVVPPPGLRMIAGNPNSVGPQAHVAFYCESSTSGGLDLSRIPTVKELTEHPEVCDHDDNPIAALVMQVNFPECWDGVHLDSPGHQAHMAYEDYYQGCPATHPFPIPQITYKVDYHHGLPGSRMDIGYWRLSSDNYPVTVQVPPGYARVANEGQSFVVSQRLAVRFGFNQSWVEKTFDAGTFTCSAAAFGGTDPAPGQSKACEANNPTATTAAMPAGYSGHGDWINGWNQTIMQAFVRNCLQAGYDCHADLLDGPSKFPPRMLN